MHIASRALVKWILGDQNDWSDHSKTLWKYVFFTLFIDGKIGNF